jgi:uncharacterized membrane-anchored protein
MVTIEDMNFATGILILVAINALIALPLALIIAGIVFAFKKKRGYTYGEVFVQAIQIGTISLTTISIIFIVVMYLRSCFMY